MIQRWCSASIMAYLLMKLAIISGESGSQIPDYILQHCSSSNLFPTILFCFPQSPTLTSIHDYWKTRALTRWTFVGKVMSLFFNMLSRLVITFLPRSKCLLISWLQSPSAVILEPRKICHFMANRWGNSGNTDHQRVAN